MDEEEVKKFLFLSKLRRVLHESIAFAETHILLEDGTVMEIGEMPAKDLRKPIAKSFEASTLKVDLDSIDISKEMEMLYGSRKEKTND